MASTKTNHFEAKKNLNQYLEPCRKNPKHSRDFDAIEEYLSGISPL